MQRVNIENQYMFAKTVAANQVFKWSATDATGTYFSATITLAGDRYYENMLCVKVSATSATYTINCYNVRTLSGITSDFLVNSYNFAKNTAADKFIHGMGYGTDYIKIEGVNDVINSGVSSNVYWAYYNLG